jgi:hypothetical protein
MPEAEKTVTRARPKKGDKSHTAVERVEWITRGGNERARVLCECGESWEAYGERAANAHAKHRDAEQPA